MRPFFLILTLILTSALPIAAQERDSVFKTYADYAAFVDAKVMTRDFIPLVQTLGGRDEYTMEQLNGLNAQLLNVFRQDFQNVTVFKQLNLGGGIRQEGRMYWTGESYAFYYALLHDRGNEVVVINFHLNSSAKAILERF